LAIFPRMNKTKPIVSNLVHTKLNTIFDNVCSVGPMPFNSECTGILQDNIFMPNVTCIYQLAKFLLEIIITKKILDPLL
jgi:hypothetical protein